MDTAKLVSLISFAGIVSGCGALFFGVMSLFRRGKGEAALKRELRRLPRIRQEAAEGVFGKFDAWFERALYISGSGMTSLEGVLLIVLVSLAGAGAMFVATENELFTLLAGVMSVTLVLIAIELFARRRQTRFEQQFPTALDLLARAVRAGESFDQSLLLVGEASEDPVGPEFTRCARQLELGLSMQECMTGLAQRANLMDVQIFANAVSVYREAGGNLPITMERLAEVIRDRHSYHRQLKSVTGAGRFSAMLITALGPILFAYLFFLQPEYGRKLVEDPMGKWMLLVAVLCQITGIVWVLRLLKNEY